MYRPIPELYPKKGRPCQYKQRTAPIPGMTYFAPVTMATRPCKSSRSRSGEIFDVALPIASTRGSCKDCVDSICRALRGFMNYDKYLEPSLFGRDSILFKRLPIRSRTWFPSCKLTRNAHTTNCDHVRKMYSHILV